MKQYKVEVVKEGVLGTLFLGSSKLPIKKMEEVMNKYGKDGWDVSFQVTKYTETCAHNGATLLNTYYVDDKALVRKSFQYHSDTVGFITLERLDR